MISDIDIDYAQSVGQTSITINSTANFAPEWLSFEFMDQVFKGLQLLDESWINNTGGLSLYASTIEDISDTEPPKLKSYKGHGGNGSHGDSRRSGSSKKNIPEDSEKLNFESAEKIKVIIIPKGMTMLDKIGGTQTVLLEDTVYGLTGITKDGDDCYFKFIGQDLKDSYLKIDGKSLLEINTGFESFLELKDKSMILNSPNIGEDNLIYIADPGECFFVSGVTTVDGIDFINIVDKSGKTCYVPKNENTIVDNFLNTNGEEVVDQ